MKLALDDPRRTIARLCRYQARQEALEAVGVRE